MALNIAANFTDPTLIFGGVHASLAHDFFNGRRYGGRQTHPRTNTGKRDQIAVMALITIDLDIGVIEVPEQLRVNALNVIALIKGIDTGLPVTVPLDPSRPWSLHSQGL